MKNRWNSIIAITAVLAALSVQAQIPEMINYQGRVVTSGTNYHGIGQFKFAVVDEGTNISEQAAGAAILTGQFVTSVTVTDGGDGYSTPPAISFSGGGGSSATAHSLISGGVVTDIIVDSAGTGYVTPPTVIIGAPPVSMEYTTYWSNDGTASGEPTNAVSLTVTRGLFSVLLGNTNLTNMATLPAGTFSVDPTYLRVWFSDGGPFEQLTPDQRLASVPYAMKAGSALDNILTVGEGGQYASISDALNAITDNSVGNPYLIKVGPGTYTEQVIMKSYVEIEGAGEYATTIYGTGITNLNSSGTVIAAENSAIRQLCIFTTNSLTDSNTGAVCLFGNYVTNFIARDITCKAYGGYVARGCDFRYSSPLLENITAEASGANYSTGFNFSGLNTDTPVLNDVIARVWGAAWYDKAINVGDGSPRINNAFCHSLGDDDGDWNWAIDLGGTGGKPILNNVIALADATLGENKGLFVSGPVATITNSKITGEGSSGDNYGIDQFSATVKVHNSLIKGTTAALDVSNSGSVIYAANCQIDGTTTAAFGGLNTLVNCYDENFISIP